MRDTEFWQSVVTELETAFHEGNLCCTIADHVYKIHYEDYQHSKFWNIRFHIIKSSGKLAADGLIFVNGTIHVLSQPDYLARLEKIGGQLAVLKRMCK